MLCFLFEFVLLECWGSLFEMPKIVFVGWWRFLVGYKGLFVGRWKSLVGCRGLFGSFRMLGCWGVEVLDAGMLSVGC